MEIWYYKHPACAIAHLISYAAAVPSILHMDEATCASRLSAIFYFPKRISETPPRLIRTK